MYPNAGHVETMAGARTLPRAEIVESRGSMDPGSEMPLFQNSNSKSMFKTFLFQKMDLHV